MEGHRSKRVHQDLPRVQVHTPPLIMRILSYSMLIALCGAAVRIVAADAQPYPISPLGNLVTEPEHFDELLWKTYPSLKKLASPGNPIVPLQELKRDITIAASSLPPRVWPTTFVAGRMPLPAVLISEVGINGGLDNSFGAELLAQTQQERLSMTAFGFLWRTYLQQHPEKAFNELAQRSSSGTVSTQDLLILSASIANIPGGLSLGSQPARSDWQVMRQSTNPCYRFLALEYFDSFDQTPEELLQLYRECLFGSCSYLESRALMSINQFKDYRTAVAELLQEYAASKPIKDDGTLSKIRAPFGNLEEASIELAKTIREFVSKHGEKVSSVTTPSNSGRTTEPPMKSPGSPNSSPDNRERSVEARPYDTSFWLPIVAMIVTAIGLLWLLRKRRS